VRSSMDIYGELSVVESGKSDMALRGTASSPTKIGHGAQTYMAGSDLGINQKLGFSYSVQCDRNPVVTIGNELPSRVTKENVRINIDVRGEDLGTVVTTTGYAAIADIYVYNVYQEGGGFIVGALRLHRTSVFTKYFGLRRNLHGGQHLSVAGLFNR